MGLDSDGTERWRESAYDGECEEDDPYTLWEFWSESSEEICTEFEGETCLVIEAVEPLRTEDAKGRPTLSLHFRWRPFVPAGTGHVFLFVVDNEYNVTMAINAALVPTTRSGHVELTDFGPHKSWILTDQEECLTLVLILLPTTSHILAETSDVLLDEFIPEGLEDVVSLLDMCNEHEDVDVLTYRFSVEEADEIMRVLGWRR